MGEKRTLEFYIFSMYCKKELGVTIFLTTHYLEEADMLSDTICFI